jgi:hypothetical protein
MERLFQIRHDEENEYRELYDLLFKDVPDLNIDQMVRTGLIYVDKTGDFHFIHLLEEKDM